MRRLRENDNKASKEHLKRVEDNRKFNILFKEYKYEESLRNQRELHGKLSRVKL
jgi:hypothetical protein